MGTRGDRYYLMWNRPPEYRQLSSRDWQLMPSEKQDIRSARHHADFDLVMTMRIGHWLNSAMPDPESKRRITYGNGQGYAHHA